MKFFLAFCSITLWATNVFSAEIKQTDYGFKLGSNIYLQKSQNMMAISENGKLKKLNIYSAGWTNLYKLSNEYVIINIIPYSTEPIIHTMNFNYKVKKIDMDLSNIPEYLINSDFWCDHVQNGDKIYFTCKNSEYKKQIYKFIYSNGKFTKANSLNSTNVKKEHCLREYKIYQDLRKDRPRNGYIDDQMPLSIVRGLNVRLKNVEDDKYTRLLNSKISLTLQQFTVKHCY